MIKSLGLGSEMTNIFKLVIREKEEQESKYLILCYESREKNCQLSFEKEKYFLLANSVCVKMHLLSCFVMSLENSHMRVSVK